jgi:ParB/RepB/Spo0J family partition protein
MKELMDSIAARGLDTPIILRPVPEDAVGTIFEIVRGHRRCRACLALEHTQIPAEVRVLSDKEALEEQLTEVAHQVPLHPLEEADAYKRAIEDYGDTPGEIAARLGKSRSFVQQRLVLTRLAEPARAPFLRGEFGLELAFIMARIPASLQAEAIGRMRWQDGTWMDPQNASRLVQREYMLHLELAPFDRGDPALIEGAGACTTCQKRSGAQLELFGDVASPDMCTDPPCYEQKVAEDWERKQAAAHKGGRRVLHEEEAKRVFSKYGTGLCPGMGYIALQDPCPRDPQKRPYSALLPEPPPTILARDPYSPAIYELLDEKEAGRLIEAAGHDFTPSPKKKKEKETETDPKEEARKKAQALRNEVAALVRFALPDIMEKSTIWQNPRLWALATEWMILEARRDADAVLARRGISFEAIPAYCTSLPRALGLLLEVLFDEQICGGWDGYTQPMRWLCEALGIDLADLEGKVAAHNKDMALKVLAEASAKGETP